MKNKKELISDSIFNMFGCNEYLINTIEEFYDWNDMLGGAALKNLSPSIEEFKKAGFKILENKDGSYNVYLPYGWTAQKMRFYSGEGTIYKQNSLYGTFEVDEEATRDNYIDEIIKVFDEKGNVRAQMRSGLLAMKRRYDVFTDIVYDCEWENIIGDPVVALEIYFGNDEEKVFSVGSVVYHENMSDGIRLAYDNELKKVLKKARELADEHYPEWRKYDAYWDREKVNEGLVRYNVGPRL